MSKNESLQETSKNLKHKTESELKKINTRKLKKYGGVKYF